MEKRSFKPIRRMKGLDKASKAVVKFLSLPKMIETEFDTGFGPNNVSKWSIELEVIKHPNNILGKMEWHTTAEVVRLQIYGLVLEAGERKALLNELLKDLGTNNWEIERDEQGLTGINEL